MKIWIICEGEPLPMIRGSVLMRMGLLAESLSKRGHDVVWWSSTFIHGSKTYYVDHYKKVQLSNYEKIILLHSRISYKKNISLYRIIYHHNLAIEFRKHCQEERRPDVILCSYPTAQFCMEAERYAKKYNVPIIIDVRDLWPDIFVRAFPDKLNRFVRIGLFPLDIQANHVMKNSDAIIGVVPYMLEWGLRRAQRKPNKVDQVIYIGSTRKLTDEADELEKELNNWRKLGVTEKTWNLCFVGTLSSNSLDLDICIMAAKELSLRYSNFRFILCGDGDGANRYKELSKNCRNIVFAGWCDKYQIQSLFNIGNAGLYPYKNLEDFTNAFGNKIIKYMSNGLPVISSLAGFSKRYIERYNFGIVYKEADKQSCFKAIESLIKNPMEAKIMGINANKRFEIDFDMDVINNKFEKMIYEIVARRSDEV